MQVCVGGEGEKGAAFQVCSSDNSVRLSNECTGGIPGSRPAAGVIPGLSKGGVKGGAFQIGAVGESKFPRLPTRNVY